MKQNQLTIKRIIDPDVSEVPCFSVEVFYEGHHIVFDDIYIDNISDIISNLQKLEQNRKGEVVLYGGNRFKLCIKTTFSGGLDISFQCEQHEPTFPGHCILKGSFSVAGELIKKCMDDFGGLLNDGNLFVIHQS